MTGLVEKRKLQSFSTNQISPTNTDWQYSVRPTSHVQKLYNIFLKNERLNFCSGFLQKWRLLEAVNIVTRKSGLASNGKNLQFSCCTFWLTEPPGNICVEKSSVNTVFLSHHQPRTFQSGIFPHLGLPKFMLGHRSRRFLHNSSKHGYIPLT